MIFQFYLCLVFFQNRLLFQTEGTPLAVELIAIHNSFLETVRITFSALNTSNQDRNIKEILFINIRSRPGGCCSGYLFVPPQISSVARTLLIFYEWHKFVNVMSLNFDPRRNTWGFKTKQRFFRVVLT